MIQYDTSFQRLAFCLAGLAGFVDAIGFLGSGGLFVSFMSGNSTRMAIGITEAKLLPWPPQRSSASSLQACFSTSS